jgi:hypothetical protein
VHRVVQLLSLFLLLTACSGGVEGVPTAAAPTTVTNAGGEVVVVGKPKNLGEKLDCAKVMPTETVSSAAGVQANQDKAKTDECFFKLGSDEGRARLYKTGVKLGNQNGDFQGNTLYADRPDDKECSLSVATNQNRYLVANMLLYTADRGDVCERGKRMLEHAFAHLPGG